MESHLDYHVLRTNQLDSYSHYIMHTINVNYVDNYYGLNDAPWVLGAFLAHMKDNLKSDWLKHKIGNKENELFARPLPRCEVYFFPKE